MIFNNNKKICRLFSKGSNTLFHLKKVIFLAIVPYDRLYSVNGIIPSELWFLSFMHPHVTVCHILKHHSDLDELPADVPMQSVGINLAGSVQIRYHTLWMIIMCGSELYIFVCSLDSFHTVTAHTPNTMRKLVIISDLWSLRRKPPKYSVCVCVCLHQCFPSTGDERNWMRI